MRVSLETEKIGLDIAEHGGMAYEMGGYRARSVDVRSPSVFNEIFGRENNTAMDQVIENKEAESEQ